MPSSDLAIPFFGYKSHISIDRKYRFIRKWKTTHAASSDGARLREGLLDKTNTASTIWADTAYRSKANEDFMEKHGFVLTGGQVSDYKATDALMVQPVLNPKAC